jgi:selenocysteine lyase/cysteine desulfurase
MPSSAADCGSAAIDAPVGDWRGKRLLRVSIAPYNQWEDVERLEAALRALL